MTKTFNTFVPANQPLRALSPMELRAVTGGATRSSGNTVDKNYNVRVSGKNAKTGS